MKACSQCFRVLPLTSFYSCGSRRMSECMQCNRERKNMAHFIKRQASSPVTIVEDEIAILFARWRGAAEPRPLSLVGMPREATPSHAESIPELEEACV